MPDEQKKFTVLPGLEDIEKMNIKQLTELKLLLQRFEDFVSNKIRKTIQR